MMAMLGLGTYRCRNVAASARRAVTSGTTMIDTAPVYAHGSAHTELARALVGQQWVRISTKVGHMTRQQAESARRAGIVTDREASRCHSVSPAHFDHRITINTAELCRERLDLLYLHNPEHDAHGDRDRLHRQITRAFTVCEQAASEGRITGYGIATWNGFSNGAFTVRDILTAAREAAGGPDIRLAAIQLPVSLVQLASVAGSLNGTGPVAQASDAGLEVWASAPLSGGELVDLVTSELADFIEPGLSPVAAALAVVASTPGLTGALLSASTAAHWRDALDVFERPPISASRLREVCRVLRA